jgi:hypothetical protein
LDSAKIWFKFDYPRLFNGVKTERRHLTFLEQVLVICIDREAPFDLFTAIFLKFVKTGRLHLTFFWNELIELKRIEVHKSKQKEKHLPTTSMLNNLQIFYQ